MKQGEQTLASGMKPTVFVVDDDPSVRKGLTRLVRSAGYAVETFESADRFLEEHRHDGPGCLVLDVQLPGLDGLALQERLSHRDDALPIVFMTGHGDIPMSVKAIKAGAHDFLPKPFDGDDMLRAIGAAIEKDLRESAAHAERRALKSRYDTLTPRERDVFAHLLSGKLNKQIACDIGTVEKTVKVHRARVLEKFGVSSVAELVRIAGKLGTLPPD